MRKNKIINVIKRRDASNSEEILFAYNMDQIERQFRGEILPRK